MSVKKIKLDSEVVENVNAELGERFIESVEACSDNKIVVNTFDYGSVEYTNDTFFGEPAGSAHDLIKYEVYNKYLEDMNKYNKSLYELLK